MRNFSTKTVAFMVFFCMAFAFLAFASSGAYAAWWRFGKSDDVPEIADLRFNAVDARNVETHLILGRDDLDQGRVIVRGRATLYSGTIGRVDISLDGGQTWQRATLGDRGMFTFEFTPEMERTYQFAARVLTTAGKSSDLADYAFEFTISNLTNTDAVRAAFMELIAIYMNKDAMGFMNRVSPNYYGDRSGLTDAIRDDFRALDNIRIQVNITRIVGFDGRFQVYFTFNRSAISARTGKPLGPDQLASTAEFSRDGESYMLYGLGQPLIFGLSNPDAVASSPFVTLESVGKPSIIITRDGEAKEEVLGQTGGQSSVVEGTATLTSQGWEQNQGFVFQDEAVVDCNANPDFCIQEGQFMQLGPGVQVRDLGARNIDDITQVPDTGYSGQAIDAQTGRVYAFKLFNGHYALIVFTELGTPMGTGGGYGHQMRSVFRYKYQTSKGSRSF
ncbi:MAG: hypothetical protein QMD09_11655 [Desulfatibacillaceae bacterium]|nr:hypothetical protein [Desulfatibacillaceae bacterium]